MRHTTKTHMVSMTGSMALMRCTNTCPDSSRTLDVMSRSEKICSINVACGMMKQMHVV